jgi:subtilisin family serine protease
VDLMTRFRGESMDRSKTFGYKVPLRIYSILTLLVFVLIASGCSKALLHEKQVFPEGSADCAESAVKTRYLVKKKDGSIERVRATSREEMLEKYVRPKIDELEYVEAEKIIYATDSQGDGQITPSSTETWGAERVQVQEAWNQNIKGQGVIVAVVDSGVEISHPALQSQIYTNMAELNGVPGVDDDHNGYIDDVHGWDFSVHTPINHDTSGHGTHVSGIIAANSSVMSGVAPLAKILPLDFMDGGSGYTGDAINAIEYAKSMNARVINASWGSSFCSKLLNNEIDSLAQKNILFVVAAGNSGNDLSRFPEYPAAFVSSPQITVGAITQRGFMASFSNYGALVDVMAPGDQILSSYTNGDYMYLSGTSMAAPFVSGIAALLISQKPNVSVLDLKNAIMNSVIKRNYSVKSEGEINVPQAISAISNL